MLGKNRQDRLNAPPGDLAPGSLGGLGWPPWSAASMGVCNALPHPRKPRAAAFRPQRDWSLGLRPPGPHTSLPPGCPVLGAGGLGLPRLRLPFPGVSIGSAHTPFPLSPTELPLLPPTPHLPESSCWSEFPVGIGLPAEPPTGSAGHAERGLCRVLPQLLNVTCPPSVPTSPSR